MTQISMEELLKFREVEPTALDLKTQLVAKGMTSRSLAQGENSTFRILCYAPCRGEDHGLHGHIEEEHAFFVLHGVAEFSTVNGKLPTLNKNQGLFLPKGCFYEFINPGPDSLVVLRCGATAEQMERSSRLTPRGEPIPGRSKRHPHLNDVKFIDGAFLE
jgi:mannose-6-phosphate isomerase-like protein (cupin superfamily)